MRTATLQALAKRQQKKEEAYREKVKPWMDMVLTDGEITVEPIRTVMDVYKEGKELNHCIFTMNYHNKQDRLLLSARKDGKRLETVEYSLETKRVVQCRGKNNLPTEYNNRIRELVNTGMQQKLAG